MHGVSETPVGGNHRVQRVSELPGTNRVSRRVEQLNAEPRRVLKRNNVQRMACGEEKRIKRRAPARNETFLFRHFIRRCSVPHPTHLGVSEKHNVLARKRNASKVTDPVPGSGGAMFSLSRNQIREKCYK